MQILSEFCLLFVSMACAIKTLWSSPFQVAHTVPHRPMRWCLATEAHLPAEGLFLKRSASSEAIGTYSEASKLSCLHNNHQKLFVDCSKCIWKTTRLSLSGIIKLTHWSRHKIAPAPFVRVSASMRINIYIIAEIHHKMWGFYRCSYMNLLILLQNCPPCFCLESFPNQNLRINPCIDFSLPSYFSIFYFN